VELKSIWFVKGIVSSSLLDGRKRCDVSRYAVFTDVTQYMDWISTTLAEAGQ